MERPPKGPSSEKGLGGWGQKITIFANIHYLNGSEPFKKGHSFWISLYLYNINYADVGWIGGWVRKSPKICQRNIVMVPRVICIPTHRPWMTDRQIEQGQSSYWTVKSSFLFLASNHTKADTNYTLGWIFGPCFFII